MGKVEDYINSLEGQEDLSLPEVVSELLKLHNEEISTSTAKIGQLETSVTERDNTIAEKSRELSIAKAANWDLVNRIPSNDNGTTDDNSQGDEINQKSITLDDAFEA